MTAPNERLDDLQFAGLRILQRVDAFRFGMDAVLLADFARVRPDDRVADLGTGTGILLLLLSPRVTRGALTGVELQPDMADLARRNAALNGLEARVRVLCGDVRDAPRALGFEAFDAVVCNPPYGAVGSAIPNPQENTRVARHETGASLSDFVTAAARLSRNGGRAYFALPAPRLLELCDRMREARLAPKRLRLVHHSADRAPYLALLEGVKNARPGLAPLPPLIAYGADGAFTPEMRRIYHMEGDAAAAERP